MGKCVECGKEVFMPFKCSYCNHTFCSEHRLPEKHNCVMLPQRRWRGTKPRTNTPTQIPNKEKRSEWEKTVKRWNEEDPKKRAVENKSSSNKSGNANKTYPIFAFLILTVVLIFSIQYSKPETQEYLDDAAAEINQEIESTISDTKEWVNEAISDLSKTWEDNSPKNSNSIDLAEVEQSVFHYTNIERTNNGLEKLVWDDSLSIIAREHSEDLAENEYFAHENLKGEDPTDRAIRHGYPIRKDLGGGWYTMGIGENIGSMHTGNVEGVGYVSRDAASIAKALVQAWMNSPGHRENLLNPDYDNLGVGVAFDGTYYISTQNFW